MSNLSIIRISRHPLTEEREAFLRSVFGDDLMVVTEDIRYGDDPVGAVKALIEQVEADHNSKVVAVEAQAPFPVTMKLVDARRDMGVRLIRAQFMRDDFGRAIVVGQDERGRDVLKFSHYEELKRIVFDTQRLEV
jgi:hypothetical protein